MSETKINRGLYYGWWIVFGSFFVYGFGGIINFTLTMYAPFILKEMNWTMAHVANINTVFLLIVLMLGVAAGWFIDKYGPKRSILIGSAVGALGMVLFSMMQSMAQAYIFFSVIVGIAIAMQLTLPTQILVRRWFFKRAALATGVMMSSFGFIGAIFFPLFAKMAGIFGWRSMVLWSGIVIQGFIFLLTCFIIKDSPENIGLQMDGIPDEEARASLGALGKVMAEEPHMTRGEALKSAQFWIVGLSLSLASMVFTGFLFNATMIGLSVGMTAGQAGLVMSAWALPSVLGRSSGGWVADKLGKRKTFILFGFLTAVGYTYAWLFADSPASLYIFAIWSGIFMSPVLVIIPPLFGDLFGRLYLASILSFYGLIIGIVGALGPFIAGRIAEAANSYQPLYLLGAVANVFLAVLIFFVKPTRVELQMEEKRKLSI